MKNLRCSRSSIAALILSGSIASLLTAPLGHSATYYWDTDGITAGFGTGDGTWGTDTFWSTSSAGTIAPAVTATTSFDDVWFGTSTTGYLGGRTVTVNGTQNARLITFGAASGTVALTSGTISLGTLGGITIEAGAANDATISSNLSISGAQTFAVGAGRTLTLNTGTFTRNAGATLSVASTGTVSASMTGLAAGSLSNNIIGPWASYNSGASTTYATINGSNQVVGLGYTGSADGTTAAASTSVTDATGTVNYTLGAAGTLGASASVNTLRYTGAAGTLTTSTAFASNGIMNAGSGLLTISGNLTIGATKEIVFNAANADITVSNVIANNAGGASSLTKNGSGGLYLAGGNTFSGGVTLNTGTLYTGSNSSAFGTGTLTINGGRIDISAAAAGSGTTVTTTNPNKWNASWTMGRGSTGTATWNNNGSVLLGGNVSVTSANNTTNLNLGGAISDGGNNYSLTFSTNTVTLSGTNTYGGGTTIGTAGSIVQFANLVSMPATGTVAVSGGTLAVNIGGSGQWTTGTSGNGTLGGLIAASAVGGQGNTVTWSGASSVGVDTSGASGAQTYSGAIVNRGTSLGLNKLGAGTLALTGTNTYTGGTTITAGTLQVGAGSTTGKLPTSGALTNNSALVFNRSDNVSQGTDFTSSAMSGTGTLTMLGNGTLTLSAANTYTGNTYVPGTLSLTNKNGIGSSALDTTSGGVVSLNAGAGTYQFGGLIGTADLTSVITGNAANMTNLTLNVGGSVSYTGVISDLSPGMSLTKTGSGTSTQTLGTANTYTGATTVSAGTLVVPSLANGGSSSSIGASSNAASSLILNGGTFKYTGAAVDTDRLFSLQASSSIDSSGSGALNFSNAGTMGFNGGTAAKTLTLTGNNQGSNTIAAIIGNNTGLTSVTKAGSATWVLSGLNTYTGITSVNSSGIPTNQGIVQFGILAATKLANGGVASSIGQSSNAAANLVIGNGAIFKYIGTGDSTDRAFTISGDNAASTSGALDASGTGAINWTSTSAVAYGTTNLTRTFTLMGSNTANNSLSLLIGDNGTSAVSLIKAGKGTWVLNGPVSNTYSGSTTVATGTLVLDFANLATPTNLLNSASALTLGGGTLKLQGKSGTDSTQAFSGNPTFSSAAGAGISLAGTGGNAMTLTLTNTWTRSVGGTVNVTLGSGGTLTSSPTLANSIVVGSSNIAFATVGGADWATVSSGNVTAYGGYNTSFPATGATSTVNYSLTDNGSVTTSETANTLKISTSQVGQSLAITSGQTLTLNAGGLLFVGANDYSITGGTLKGSGGTQKDLVVHQFGSGNLTIGSVIADNTSATALTKTGTGTLTLSAANTFTGNTYAGGGGTLVLANQNALQSSVLNMNNSSVVFDSSVTGNAFTLMGLASGYSGPGYDIALQNNAASPAPVALTLRMNSTANLTYYGNLSGAGSLNITMASGTGTINFGGYNTFTGGTTIGSGVSVGGALPFNDWFLGGPNSQTTVNSGGTLKVNRSNGSIGTVTLNGGTLDSGNGFGTTIYGGVILSANSILNTGFVMTMSGVISGSGGFNKTGTSTLTLSAANTFRGSASIGAGTMQLSNSLALQNATLDTTASIANALTLSSGLSSLILGGLSGSKNLDVASGAMFATSGSNYATVATLTLNPSSTQSPSYSGAIVNGAPGMSLTKTGAGTQTLLGTNTYTGVTTISAGTLQFGKTAALYSGTSASWTAANIKVSNGATLAVNVGGTGEFAAGDVTTLLTNLGGANGTSSTGFASGSTIGFDTTNATGGIFTIADAIADSTGTGGGAVGVTKLGSGTLVLSSATHAYTGATTVNGGTLKVSGSLTATTALTVNNGATFNLGAVGGVNSSATLGLGTGSGATSGGTLQVADNLGTNTSAFTNSFGALSLGFSSTIDFGTSTAGNGVKLLFAGVGTHTGGATLSITNWDGVLYTQGSDSTDRLVFTGTTTSFTSLYAQSDVLFNGVAGYSALDLGNGTYEIVAIPEPSTWFAIGLALGLVAYRQRRRFVRP